MTFLCSDLLFLNLLNQNNRGSYIITAFCEATICFEVTFIVWFQSTLQRKWRPEVKNWKKPPNCSSPFQINQVGLKSFLPWVCMAGVRSAQCYCHRSAQGWGTGIPPSTSTGSCGITALDTSQGQLPVLAATKDTWKGSFLTQDLTSGTEVGLTVLCWKEHRGGWEMSWIKASKVRQVHLCSTSGTTASFWQVERASLTPYSGQI